MEQKQIADMTVEEKWADLGRQHELLIQCQNNINVLRQGLVQPAQQPDEIEIIEE